MDAGVIAAAAATAFAGIAGYALSVEVRARWRKRRLALEACGAGASPGWAAAALREGFPHLVLGYAVRLSGLSHQRGNGKVPSPRGRTPDVLAAKLAVSGLQEKGLTLDGLREAQLRLAAACAAAGLLAGLPFSAMLAGLLALVGLLAGWRLPAWCLERQVAERAEVAERHLPEMLDVVSLGLRSGLSFDAALAAYCGHFDTLLAQEMRVAKDRWTCGLATRDEALADVAAAFDSAVLGRVLGDVVRSLRYGSALSASLDAVSRDVRKEYRARKQEEVAKAPVKMMVPTGVLILPAMLILVLGPVMLELMEGF